jgi:hypothetical protein
MMLSGAMTGNVTMSIAGMMAKYFATSFAMLNVVSAPRVIKSCFPISMISKQLRRIRVEVNHVARFLRGLRAGVHRHADVGLRERGRVVRAVADHRHHASAGLFLADEREFVLRFRLGEKIIHARLLAIAAAVNLLSPVIITVRMPIARKRLKRSANAAFHDVLEMNHAERAFLRGDDQRRAAGT